MWELGISSAGSGGPTIKDVGSGFGVGVVEMDIL